MTGTTLTGAQVRILEAVIDRIVPQDAAPGATGFGADRYILGQLGSDLQAEAGLVAAGLDELARLALGFGGAFHAMPPTLQDTLLQQVQAEPWFIRLAALAQEGVYADPDNGGNAGLAAWRMIGYEPRLPEGPSGPPRQTPAQPRVLGATQNSDYDVIVVGAGAAGGVMACRLSEAGRTVLLLERGRELRYERDGHRDHLRNHRLAQYGHNTGPELEGNPRVFIDDQGEAHIVRPHEPFYHNNAAGVGSGTFLYGGLAWRFHPDDFRMATLYGMPENSSLVDWPIDYGDLAPYYDWIEWEVGVAGKAGGNKNDGPRARDYPMPPLPPVERTHLLARGAVSLGIDTFTPPILINTLPFNGRGACIQCGSCVGFPCPSDGKNGTQNTMVPRALATGRTTLVTGAAVSSIEQAEDGTVTGVSYWQQTPDGVEQRLAGAKAVVVCAGAIESARLLLLSGSSAHPDGLGNAHDQVGRHLQGHYYPAAYGLFDEEVHVSKGPGVTIATTAYNHGNPGIIGGAMIADDFVMLPTVFVKQALPPNLPFWGQATKDFMRQNFRRVAKITGPVHETPDPECRVTLANLSDRFGRRVAQLSGQTHPETVRTADYIRERALDWLASSGARSTWGAKPQRRLSAGQHQAGTCRMGIDPASSVTDAHGRVWGHKNLFVSDASLHPTNGGFNPVLTIMAMAARNAEHIHAAL